MMHAATFLALAVAVQGQPSGPAAPSPNAGATATAVRATRPPVIDGIDDDEVWRLAPAITAFREFQPVEDDDPRFPTEARVAYDARNLYVFVRAFDPAPDSIQTLLSRRDVRSSSDQLKVVIDSYHDRRTGFEFAVNPAGVKRDYAIYNDQNEDSAWDGVWEVGTRVDSLGWTAEFRIPLSQLRYAPGPSNTFGFGIWRDIERYTERVSWPVYRVSRPGLSSQLGVLTGLEDLPAPRRLEAMPYAVAKSDPIPVQGGSFDRTFDATVGADFKYGITSNLTLDATVNPDFGQVEADPAVLNLSAFETFFQERRPFFVEGTGIFRFNVNCNVVNCGGENLFYSRRIGRRPQLSGAYGDATSATASTIIGAGKLTGRLPGGLSLGLLEAVTQRETGTENRTVEPLTNYAVLRAQQDLRGGESGVGVVFTSVNRDLDEWTESFMHRSAYVAALDFRHRFLNKQFELSGALGASRVEGAPDAIARTQRSPARYFQRPDGELTYDPTRTTLTGGFQELKLGKVGGGLIRLETSYQRRSPGLELNDLGFLRRAGQHNWNTWGALQFQRPTAFFRRGFWNFNWWQYWTTEGLPQDRGANTNFHAELHNRWWIHGGGTYGQLGATYCDGCARGGPAVRNTPFLSVWGGFEGDQRPSVTPFLWLSYFRGDDGLSRSWDVSPSIRVRVASRFSTEIGVSVSENRDDNQWFGNFPDGAGVTHYTFAHLEQRTTSVNWRMDFTMSPTLSLQVYAQPFVSKGTYSDVRELADPRAVAYAARYQPYAGATPGGFNFKQFRSNVVLRWEYLPGSTLFVVWNQGREDSAGEEGFRTMSGDFRQLFRMPAENIFLIKASYWLNR